jgi:hypothetical protein
LSKWVVLSFCTIEISQPVGVSKRLGSRVELEGLRRRVNHAILADRTIKCQSMSQAQGYVILDLLVEVEASLVDRLIGVKWVAVHRTLGVNGAAVSVVVSPAIRKLLVSW